MLRQNWPQVVEYEPTPNHVPHSPWWVISGAGVRPATLTLVPRAFFDACDGLFTNYNWKEEHLERTRKLAGSRHFDVYVGIDVFARGDVIGGGFDTDKVGVLGLGWSGTLGLPPVQGSELPPTAVPCHAVQYWAANLGMQQWGVGGPWER